MMSIVRPALTLLCLFSVLTGLVYPLAITLTSQTFFRHGANGSLVERDGRIIGSALIGQAFTSERYFWPRPSAAGLEGYDAASSSGSNLGPTSKALMDRIQAQIARHGAGPVAADAVTASGSGLDPHISPENARAQVARIAAVRGLDPARVLALVDRSVEGPDLLVIGEPRVHVLRLNLALDGISPRL